VSSGRRLAPLVCAAALAAGATLGARPLGAGLRVAVLGRFECTQLAVRGLVRVPGPELARAAALPPGTTLLAVEPEEVEARLRAHPWILEARVHRLPPSALLVEVVERRPVAVAVGARGQHALVDGSGTRFAPAAPAHLEALPLLHGLAPEPRDARLEVAEALRVAELLRRQGLPEAEQISVGRAAREEGLALVLRGESARILLGSERAADALRRLARSRAAGLPELAAARTIDLRFAGRVVLRGGPPPGGDGLAAERGGATPPTRGPSG
jgi:hypothetical protein